MGEKLAKARDSELVSATARSTEGFTFYEFEFKGEKVRGRRGGAAEGGGVCVIDWACLLLTRWCWLVGGAASNRSCTSWWWARAGCGT